MILLVMAPRCKTGSDPQGGEVAHDLVDGDAGREGDALASGIWGQRLESANAWVTIISLQHKRFSYWLVQSRYPNSMLSVTNSHCYHVYYTPLAIAMVQVSSEDQLPLNVLPLIRIDCKLWFSILWKELAKERQTPFDNPRHESRQAADIWEWE